MTQLYSIHLMWDLTVTRVRTISPSFGTVHWAPFIGPWSPWHPNSPLTLICYSPMQFLKLAYPLNLLHQSRAIHHTLSRATLLQAYPSASTIAPSRVTLDFWNAYIWTVGWIATVWWGLLILRCFFPLHWKFSMQAHSWFPGPGESTLRSSSTGFDTIVGSLFSV